MKVRDVFIKYGEIVPWPWTPRKIRATGHDPATLVTEIVQEIEQCEDSKDPKYGTLIDQVNDLVKQLKNP